MQLCWRKKEPALAFPPTCNYHKLITELHELFADFTCIWRSCVQFQFVSKLVDLTNVKCTPNDRWTAEQSMQMKTPYVTEAHVGFLELQSKQTLRKWGENLICGTTRETFHYLLCWMVALSIEWIPRQYHFSVDNPLQDVLLKSFEEWTFKRWNNFEILISDPRPK